MSEIEDEFNKFLNESIIYFNKDRKWYQPKFNPSESEIKLFKYFYYNVFQKEQEILLKFFKAK